MMAFLVPRGVGHLISRAAGSSFEGNGHRYTGDSYRLFLFHTTGILRFDDKLNLVLWWNIKDKILKVGRSLVSVSGIILLVLDL